MEPELESLYKAAIECCYTHILHDDRETWWPKIKRIEGRKVIHEINGVECSAGGGIIHSEYDDAYSNSMLRLCMSKEETCAIFAYPVKYGIQPVDILIGFMDVSRNLTLAWDETRVYPMIGNRFYESSAIPKNTKWIVAANLSHDYRKAVSLYCQPKNLNDIKENTPKYYESVPCIVDDPSIPQHIGGLESILVRVLRTS